MELISLIFLLLFFQSTGRAQQGYEDSLLQYRREYVSGHEVVKEEGRKNIRFFPADERWRIKAVFTRKENGAWFQMKTSAATVKIYRVYGTLSFTIRDTAYRLNVYQSQDLMASEEYRDYLFLPFTDQTSGGETYESGRYIDLKLSDLKGDHVTIDFNRAYNPYCAYVSGVYACPVPPAENHLNVAVRAGEQKFRGH